jgi:ATP synthase protein I
MSDDLQKEPSTGKDAFLDKVARKTARKLKAQRDGSHGIWFGLGMSGLIGWSVAVPTLAGAFFGLWLDRHHPASHSWTLSLLVVGLALGSFNAWHWLAQQDKAINDESGGSDE